MYKRLVIFTSVIMLGGSAFFFCQQSAQLPNAITINTRGQPSIGRYDAKVHVVVFEDLKCRNCEEFNQKVYPQLKEKYIDKGKVRLTIIPIAFLEGSERLGNALMTVYNTNPDRIMGYLDQVQKGHASGRSNWDSDESLLSYAVRAGDINLVHLEACIKMDRYSPEMKKNYAMAKRIMGKDLGTPTVFINGVPIASIRFNKISKRIEKLLKEP